MRRRDWLLAGSAAGWARGQWVAAVGFRLAGEDFPLPMVEVQINDAVLHSVVIDTGNVAAPLVVSQAVARACAMPVSEGQVLPGAYGVGGGGGKMYRSEVARFAFAGMVQARLAAAVSPGLDALAQRSGVRLDGALGGEYFQGLALQLDYERQALTLTRGVVAGYSFASPPGKALVIVEVELNGKGPFRFAVDTGASVCAIAPALAQELKLGRGMDAQVAGAGGVEGGYFTKVGRVAAGGGGWGNLTMATGSFFGAVAAKLGTRVDGVLGANAFVRRILKIDYAARRWGIEAA